MTKTNIVYCSTFDKKLFDAVGKTFLRSFAKRRPEGDLVICYEDDIAQQIKEVVPFAYLYCLNNDKFLHNWLSDNADVIPVKYGGQFTGCKCHELPPIKHYYKNHIRRCPGLGFNLRAACWFRKVACFNYVKSLNYPILFFLDSDTVIKKYIPQSFVEDVFGDAVMFYQLGRHRKKTGTGIESGLCGWKKEGYWFIDKFIECYTSKKYRFYDRFDDGYVLRKVLEETPEINAIDIVKPHSLRTGGHVTIHSVFANYIEHFKGSTTHVHKVFKDDTSL